MKYIVNKTGLLPIAVFLMFSIAGCRGDHPPQTEGSQGFDDRKMDEAKNIPALKHAPNIPVLKHAPDWVNKGSDFLASGDKRYFIGVGYSAPVGDMALQKSVADDMARAEVERALAFFQNALAKNYLLADSNSISKVKQGGDERATKTVHVARLGASDLLAGSCPLRSDSVVGEEANAVSPMKWNWNDRVERPGAQDRDMKAEAISRLIVITQKASMANTRISGSWRDLKSSNIWSIAELDMQYLKRAIAGASDIDSELKLYIASATDEVFNRMIREKISVNSAPVRSISE